MGISEEKDPQSPGTETQDEVLALQEMDEEVQAHNAGGVMNPVSTASLDHCSNESKLC